MENNQQAYDIDSVALRAATRIVKLLTSRGPQLKAAIQCEVHAALQEYWPSVFPPFDEAAQRARFEQACYAHYLARHADRKTPDSDAPAGTIEQLMWRQPDGTYGVLMNNAAWWAWQAAQKGGV